LSEKVLVQAGETQFYVELADQTGVGKVAMSDVLSFDGVRDTIEAIAAELAHVWDRVKPDEAKVEFSLKLVAKAGKLTGLLVEGSGEATVTVSLTWTAQSRTVVANS